MNVIIMAGGSGTRFWPVSRSNQPKQFLNVIGTRPLVEETYHRVAPLVDDERIYVVVHESHRELTETMFKGKKVNILAEPLSRNTAPCIGLGLIHIVQKEGDEPVVVLPADHYIGDVDAFRRTLETTVQLAREGGIATIGIVPTRPDTGYGYIKAGNVYSEELEVFSVDAFVEKPPLALATRFLSEGGYYWNAGIFVFKAGLMLEEIRRHLPGVHARLDILKHHLDRREYTEVLRDVYRDIESVSIDYGVMEKTTTSVYVVPGWFPWSDVGSWQAVLEMRRHERDPCGNIVDGDAVVLDCRNVFIQSQSGRVIGCIGLEDVLIVDTSDALLVCRQGCAQDVRQCVDALKERGRDDVV